MLVAGRLGVHPDIVPLVAAVFKSVRPDAWPAAVAATSAIRLLAMRNVLLGLLLLLTGCSSSGTGSEAATPQASPVGEGPYLAVLSAPPQEVMVGKAQGTLMEKDGCVVLDDAFKEPTLVVWPPGYVLRRGSQGLAVADETGRTFAVFGQTILISGGYAGQYRGDAPSLNRLLARPVPSGCKYGEVFMGYAPAAGS